MRRIATPDTLSMRRVLCVLKRFALLQTLLTERHLRRILFSTGILRIRRRTGLRYGTRSRDRVLITVEFHQIEQFLPASQSTRLIPVLYRDSHAHGCSATVAQTLRIARDQMVSGMRDKRGYLRYLLAETSMQRIKRAIHDMSRPTLSPHVISHFRQEAGAIKWVPRPDMARSGMIGAHRSVFL